MKLILHIGGPKVASTAIQSSLRACAPQLAAQGAYCFDVNRGLSTRYQRLRSLPAGLRHRFDTVAEAEAWSERQWQEFEARLRADQPAVTLISSEQFLNLKQLKRAIARLRRHFSDIHVLCYLRDHLGQFASAVFQRLRAGARGAGLLTAWDLNNQMWAAPALDRYAALLGPSALTVRSAAPGNLPDNDVVADFLGQVDRLSGLRLTVSGASVQRHASLCGAAAARLLAFNENQTVPSNAADWRALRARRAHLIRTLDEATGRAALPRLDLHGTRLADVLLYLSRDRCAHLNRTFLRGQQPLPVGAVLDDVPSLDILQAEMCDWVRSYLTPDAAQALAAVPESV